MSNELSESKIVRVVARTTAKRVTRKAISILQRMKDTTSGEASGLKTTWDDIRVQIQSGGSIVWSSYEDVSRAIVGTYVAKLPRQEREASWMQTDSADDWEFDEESGERAPYPVNDDEITEYLINEYLYPQAGWWSNARIRAFIDNS